MKKYYFLNILIVALFVGNTSFAQSINPCEVLDRVDAYGASSFSFIEDAVVDNQGSIYVIGRIQGTANFGSTTLVSTGTYDPFVGKMDSSGNWLWATQMTGNNDASGDAIRLDQSGNVYITGSYNGNIKAGNDSMFGSTFFSSIFVAKLDNSGNWLWAKQAGGGRGDYSYGLEIDASGNLYIGGTIADQANFGNLTAGFAGAGINAFVAKFDSSGNWLWVTSTTNGTQTRGYGITMDGAANVICVGSYQSFSFGGNNYTSNGGNDGFVFKLDSSGQEIWTKTVGGSGSDAFSAVTVDGNNTIGIIGSFASASISIGSSNLTNAGNADVLVAKLSQNGNWLWAKSSGGSGAGLGTELSFEANGALYVTGRFTDDIVLGTSSFTSAGSYDIFVAKLDANGNWASAEQAGGAAFDASTNLAWDHHGNLIGLGSFQGTATFGTIQKTATAATFNAYISRYSAKTMTLAPMTQQNIICGSSVVLSGSANNYSSVQWVPGTALSAPDVLNPSANPSANTWYILTVTDACGQMLKDSVLVEVDPYTVDAGVDTTINQGSSILLNAQLSSAVPNPIYNWTPSTGLSKTDIANPIAGPQQTTEYIVAVSTANGCLASDTVKVTVTPVNALPSAGQDVVKLFPNPTTGQVYIQLQSGVGSIQNVVVYNQLGQNMMIDGEMDGNTMQLDLGVLPNGVYIISISAQSEVYQVKVMKTN